MQRLTFRETALKRLVDEIDGISLDAQKAAKEAIRELPWDARPKTILSVIDDIDLRKVIARLLWRQIETLKDYVVLRLSEEYDHVEKTWLDNRGYPTMAAGDFCDSIGRTIEDVKALPEDANEIEIYRALPDRNPVTGEEWQEYTRRAIELARDAVWEYTGITYDAVWVML